MHVEMISIDAAEWKTILSETDYDFYHTAEYLRLSAREEHGTPLAFCARENDDLFFLPFIVRNIPMPDGAGTPLADIICPYGYGGPLLRRSSENGPSDFFARAVKQLMAALKEQNVVSGFFRLHPLLPCPLETLQKEGHLVSTGNTVAIDLCLSAEELWRQTRSGHRSEINKAKKAGYTVEMVPFHAYVDTFHAIYLQTMQRVGAADRYLFSRDYLLDLKAALGEGLHLCLVRIEGDIACAALFTEVNGIVQYHLSGVEEAFVARHPSKVMLDYVRTWAKERGNRYLHLGGGLGSRNDSLFDFKAGFSKLHTPFYTWRVIVNPDAYTALVEQWEADSNEEADCPDGFFPAYRKTVPERIRENDRRS